MSVEFPRTIDELMVEINKISTRPTPTLKGQVIRFIRKNFNKNIHFVECKTTQLKHAKGGQNKIDFYFKERVFEMIKNSFDVRNKYIVQTMDNTEQVNPFAMCIENQTIGFIYNSYLGSAKCHRQYSFGKYKVDLFFPQHKLVVECDENNHNDRDQQNEKEREEYILSLGNTMIRFNPNEPNFDLSNVLSKINRVIHMAVYSGCLN